MVINWNGLIPESWFDRPNTIHGAKHTYRVAFWTCILADIAARECPLYEPRNKQLAFLAALIHDTARTDNSRDWEHGRRAAETKRHILERDVLGEPLSIDEWLNISNAVTSHSLPNMRSPHPGSVAAILMDADALDIERIGTHLDTDRLRHHFSAEFKNKSYALCWKIESYPNMDWTLLTHIGRELIFENAAWEGNAS